MSQKIYTNLDIKGNATIGDIANATSDTDKFLVSDAGVVKYRTGSEMLSDLGVSPGVASNVQHQVKAGVAINKGQAVYVTSADGTNMIVGLASNTSEATSSKTMGLLDNTVAINGFANVVTEGLLSGLNTIGAAAGDPVWLGTNGNLIYGLANKPSAPDHLVFIGIVTRVNANNGEIFVKVQNGFELNEIHDVDLKSSAPVGNQILAFEGAPVNLWRNKTIPSVLGYTPVPTSRTITINGNTQDLSANLSFSIASGVTSFNTRTGAITLTSGDVTGALGYTPYNSSNPAGYISSYTETDPTVPSHVKAITTTNISNWNTAFGWGNHASAGYVPGARTITINGVTQDLSANRSFTVTANAVETDTLSTVTSRGSTTSSSITAERYRGNNSLILNSYTTVNPPSNVFLYSQPNDRDSWLYLDSADTGSNWGIYHRQIDSAVSGLPGNSIGFIGGGSSALQAWISLANGSGYFAGTLNAVTLQQNGTGVVTNNGGTWGINITGNAATVTNGLTTSNYTSTLDGRYFYNRGFGSGFPSENANTMPENCSAFTYSNNSPWTGPIAHIGASGYGLQLNASYGNGDGFSYRVRNGDNATWSTWRRLVHESGTWGISVTGNSGTVGGYSVAVAGNANTIPTRNGSGYLIPENWIQLNGAYGLYSPTNNAHLKPNDSTYGSWKILGERNGWRGIHFGEGTGMTLMMNEGEFGFHREAHGWAARFTSGTGHFNVSGVASRATRANGNFYIDDNFGNTVVGVYNASRLQGVFAMGDAYKLAADGTSGGNLYGLAWSHPNAGGQAGFLSDHGLIHMMYGTAFATISSNIWCRGDIIAYSDARVKDNIQVIDKPLERLKKVRGVTFTRTDLTDKEKRYAGVIAQEMLEALPEVVSENVNGELSVSYGNSVSLLIECIKEQQVQIDELKKLINQLTDK